MQRVEKAYYKEECYACLGTGEHSYRYTGEYRDCISKCDYCNGKGYKIVEDWIEINEMYKEVLE
jgi:DnaJ-class molecular chaperone